MFDPVKAEHIYIAIGYTNLRMGIDRLAGLVANTFQQNPQSNSLFLFCGRKKGPDQRTVLGQRRIYTSI